MANLSEAEIELKKYQARMGLWKTGIIGGVVSILTALGSATVSVYTTYKEEETKLYQQKLKSEAEMQLQSSKVEYAYIGKFIEQGDIQKQLAIAEFFSFLSFYDEKQRDWEEYCEYLIKQAQETVDAEKGLPSVGKKQVPLLTK